MKTFSHTADDLVAVIPVFNEEDCIASVIQGWAFEFKKIGISYKLLVINDGSCDQTGQILKNLQKENHCIQVINQSNSGHGTSLINGYTEALILNPKFIFQVDSDNQFSPQDFELLWRQRDDYQFCIGLRANRQDGFIRHMISRTLKKGINQFFSSKLQDPNSPFRLYKTSFLRNILSSIPHHYFAPNIFLSVMAYTCSNGKILQVPVQHLARTTGKCSLVPVTLIKACIRSLIEIIYFRVSFLQFKNKVQEFEQFEKSKQTAA